ncbi:MAG: glycoside hydrolase family 127 protein [Carboxylicivirga sp.]|jgi:DUF1680 family protein|nr:glycoside hydrolase family 127 protein [Carboxylicivirga sp.]
MLNQFFNIKLLLLLICFHGLNLVSANAQINPLPFNHVTITDDFWNSKIEIIRETTVPFALKNGQTAIDRLIVCGDYLSGKSDSVPAQHRYISSDLFKCMEGAAYSLMYGENKELEQRIDDIIEIIGKAQQDDGYLYVDHICGNPKVSVEGAQPYDYVVHSHELYNVGHMYEGAVAYYQATGKDGWLKIAEKSAKHVNKVFFEGGDPNYNDGNAIMQAPGHEEIELALCKMYRVTGNELYLDMAKKFLDIRGVTYRPNGTRTMSPTYAQQHAPVKDQKNPVGHAVRAGYLYTAMADVDALKEENEYYPALNSIWSNLVDKLMHVTGGLGAGHGIEGFAGDYELPNRDAYNETCAAVANVFFNHKMFLSYKDAKYLDIAELSLFNNSLAGIGLEGNTFFYENPLANDGIKIFNKGTSTRVDWFGTACCPPNILRLILQTPGLMYSYTEDQIYLSLYASNKAELPLKDGTVKVEQEANYPFEGKIKVSVEPQKEKQSFKVSLRIPSWATDGEFVPGELYRYKKQLNPQIEITLNGESVDYQMEKGFAIIERIWEKGDEVELNLPMPVRYLDCHPAVEANVGRFAVTRGPLVYCAEATDNDEKQIQRYFVDDLSKKAQLSQFEDGLLKGVTKITLEAKKTDDDNNSSDTKLTFIPYYTWNNRDLANTMEVWIPDNKELSANSIPGFWYLDAIKDVSATYCSPQSLVNAICDGGIPGSSLDHTVDRWTTLGKPGEAHSASIEFKETKKIVAVSVYWTDRSAKKENTKVPESWNVECLVKGQWKPFELYVTDNYEVKKDQFNVIHPAEELKCDAIRINVIPQENYSFGIGEVQFDFESDKKK